MYDTTNGSPLTMRWTLETDADGRTRPVAHWLCADSLAQAARPVSHAA